MPELCMDSPQKYYTSHENCQTGHNFNLFSIGVPQNVIIMYGRPTEEQHQL